MKIPTNCPHSPDGYCAECTRLAVAVAETLILLRQLEGLGWSIEANPYAAANDAALAAYRAARAGDGSVTR